MGMEELAMGESGEDVNMLELDALAGDALNPCRGVEMEKSRRCAGRVDAKTR